MKWAKSKTKDRSKIQFGRLDHSEERKRADANKTTLESGNFKKACERAGVEPTKRQASRWNRKCGAAYARRVA
jgi:hypothetical protein